MSKDYPVTSKHTDPNAIDVLADSSGFAGLLSPADVDCQKAFETLDGVTHADLPDAGTNTHAQIDTHIAFMGLILASEIKTNDYLMKTDDFSVTADGSSDPVTISLPAAPETGRVYNIACIDSTNTVEIDPSGKNIYASSDNFPLVAEDSLTLQYNGTQWIEIS